MRTIIISCILIMGIILIGGWTQQQSKKTPPSKEKSSSKKVSYKTDIVPIFKKYCLPCHTEDQMNPSELYLDSYENLMVGGKHGKPIVAGEPDSSILIQKISSKPPFGDPMPLKRKTPFPEDTLNTLKLWIKQGAKEN
jgi:hypothetical protein